MKLKDGMTFSHEHVTIDLSGVKKTDDCNVNCFDETKEEFKELKSKNVNNIIDLTNRGMGRNVEYILRMEEETGMNILCSTGYYKEPFLPKEVYDLSEVELSKIMIKEITSGIENTSVRPDIIGEIGTSKNTMTELEKKVFQASSRAHIDTGKPIVTHTTLGTFGLEQVEFFKSYGVNLDKVIISHVDLTGDLDYILRLIDKGVNVAFDTIGKENYQPDHLRSNMLKEICNRGLSERVLLSMDITRKSNLKTRGGIGYSYLIDNFIPRLKKEGLDSKEIDNMTRDNIKRIL
ncbi:phosphotriesterase family protein [Clostridium sporogenes]|uniref:phosphotriesterase family protein n=1 Tax=Clostridium sporogenes TaxID=1509 RepID=UPI00024BA801|nr:hydrolase [Clostridium sporogenes]EHN13469.1 aryldialkylphosphatase [Clostridium sporogenes PA 3679]MCW6105417.1 phosphotriesterase-related protein [Clostridium sporogenes]MDU4599206.1 phosphotriesterase-related protein [Clostridium sporogenes]NFQ33484.1 phosphotriesterase-related protein [Clostridium sporogenes]NFQ59101.1 phosphotriesterase-related protein [Clostridium sporogenes]